MIRKHRDDSAALNTYERAGAEAEEQLQHYLERAFAAAPDVHVLNSIRLAVDEARDDWVQIDHLIAHRFGMVIVESKSVTSEVEINDHGEWSRFWDGRWRGMPSPLEQASRQAEALRGLLQHNRGQLRDKALFGLVDSGFRFCPMDCVVAISDRGRIKRSKGMLEREVVKADQVPGRVRAIIDGYKKKSETILGKDPSWTIKDNEIERVVSFLLQRHRPLHRAVPPHASSTTPSTTPAQLVRPPTSQPATPNGPPPGAASAPSPGSLKPIPAAAAQVSKGRRTQLEAAACSKCKSINVEVVHAKYGYCYRCRECAGFSPISPACVGCGARASVHKEGPDFFRRCAACGSEIVFARHP